MTMSDDPLVSRASPPDRCVRCDVRSTYVGLAPGNYREVQVQHSDGIWYPGLLEAYRNLDDVWEGYVSYSTESGETQLGWFEEDRIKGGALGEPTAFRDPSGH